MNIVFDDDKLRATDTDSGISVEDAGPGPFVQEQNHFFILEIDGRREKIEAHFDAGHRKIPEEIRYDIEKRREFVRGLNTRDFYFGNFGSGVNEYIALNKNFPDIFVNLVHYLIKTINKKSKYEETKNKNVFVYYSPKIFPRDGKWSCEG